ncbi:MAG: insulinase family protein [Firmicutes bacterium]|nr:insulinase family protein [Candidatus Colimorpha enterica]
MRPEKIMITDGVELNYLRLDKFKVNSISVDFFLPLTEETAAANTLLAKVLRRGTEKHPTKKEISKYLSSLYGADFSVVTSGDALNHFTSFSAMTLRSDFTDGMNVDTEILSLIKEMIFTPCREDGKLSEKYIEGERKNLIDRIRARKNDKDSYSQSRCLEILYGTQRKVIPVYGREETVAAVTEADLEAALERLVKNAYVVVYYIGSTAKEEIISSVSDMFAGVGRQPCAIGKTEPFIHKDKPFSTVEKMDVEQCKLCVALTSGINKKSAEYPAYRLFLNVLGYSNIAKLFMNVREKMSLCYYVYPSQFSNGVCVIMAGIDGKDAKKAKKAILKEISDCQKGKISEEELSASKQYIIDGTKNDSDSPLFYKKWYYSEVFFGPTLTPEEYADAVGKCTLDDVVAAANKVKEAHTFLLSGEDEENV